MRYNQRMVEAVGAKINKDEKIIHVCQRNNYWAVDNAQENECYECGMTTKECYLFLKGMASGIQLMKPKQWGDPGYEG